MKKIYFVLVMFLVVATSVVNAQEKSRSDAINTKIERLEKRKEKLMELQDKTEQMEARGNSRPGSKAQKRKDFTSEIEAIKQQIDQLKEQGYPAKPSNVQNDVRLDALEAKIKELEKKKEKLLELQNKNKKMDAKGDSNPAFEAPKRRDSTPQIEAIDRQLERLKGQRDLLNSSH